MEQPAAAIGFVPKPDFDQSPSACRRIGNARHGSEQGQRLDANGAVGELAGTVDDAGQMQVTGVPAGGDHLRMEEVLVV